MRNFLDFISEFTMVFALPLGLMLSIVIGVFVLTTSAWCSGFEQQTGMKTEVRSLECYAEYEPGKWIPAGQIRK